MSQPRSTTYYHRHPELCRERHKAWYRKNREHALAYRKKYTEENKEKLAASKRAWYAKNREKVCQQERTRQREKHLRTKYGMSKERYEVMLKLQKHCCAICREPFGHQRISVDHCHTTGYVRALLCIRCNSAIGMMRHSDRIAIAAAHYLSKEVLFNSA